MRGPALGPEMALRECTGDSTVMADVPGRLGINFKGSDEGAKLFVLRASRFGAASS